MYARTRTAFISLVVLGVAAIPTAAHAETVTKYDGRGDAIHRLDITKVTYRNAQRVSVRMKVPGLQRKGRAQFFIAKPNTDYGYSATVIIGPGGKKHERFAIEGDLGSEPRRCGFAAKWEANNNFVKISVPQRCLKRLDGQRRYVFVRTGGRGGDVAPAARLTRG